MVGYRLSVEADRKIAEIYEYSLLTFGEKKADSYFLGLHEILSQLSCQPKIGRVFYQYRRYEYERHVIFYKVEENSILIVNIFHEKEDIQIKAKP